MPRLIAAFVVICGLIGLPTTCGLAAEDPGTQATPTFKETLEKGLKARRPEEFAFIAMVVKKVDSGVLPRELVEGTFLWARGKGSLAFEYFRKGLIVRAQKMGIAL